MESLINAPVCHTLSKSLNSPASLLLVPQLYTFLNPWWTISAGCIIAHMRLIYSLQHTEWCYYRKINVPLVVLWGWTGCTHICSHNTTADLAVREWARERLQRNGRLCCLSKLYQASLLAQTCDIRLWVSQPARVHSSWENASTCHERMITLIDYDFCKVEEL